MENPATFDLSRRIEQWRENLAASPSFRGENLDELESHLRDSVATLQSRGLSADEAFLIATRRIGTDGALATEFSKVNEQVIWFDRALWMLTGVLLWTFVAGMIGVLARDAAVLGLKGLGYQPATNGHTIPFALISLVNLAGFVVSLRLCWWLIRRSTHGFGGWAARLLSSRKSLGFTFCALWLLVSSVTFLQMLIQPAMWKTIRMDATIFQLLNESSLVFFLVQPVVLVALVLFLARKQLRPRRV